MEKLPPSRMNLIAAIASMLGMQGNFSTAEVLTKRRGKAGKGKRFVSSSVFFPAGPHRNCEPANIRNPKIAAQITVMHEKWRNAKLARETVKAGA